ncbi:MAG: tyrosine-type recombinase/integrase [Turicibacter sp.]|nr:tyrosine-type recombinase/integrase [Turicibacter sp.]
MEVVLTANRGISERQKTHFIRHFLKLKGSNSKYTEISYERDILDFFQVKCIEDITLSQVIDVNLFDVEHYLLDLKGKGCASATINRKVSSLSSLYKWLLKYQDNRTQTALLYFNPFGNLHDEKPKVNSKETEFLTLEECGQLLGVFDTNKLLDLRNKTILTLALTTALRKSELIHIKLKDIAKYGEYDVIHVVRKGNKKDMVKIKPSVKLLIEEYVSRTQRCFEADAESYLFIGHSRNKRNNEKLDPSSLNYMIKSVCKKAGISKSLKVHSTRHTAITLAITGGASIEKVRDFAAHQNIATTNRYVHSIDKLKENAGDFIHLEDLEFTSQLS